jgi:hypothetical protein
MARPLRIDYPGAVYHVTSRGNARAAIFLDDTDRQTFLDVLASAVEKYNWLYQGAYVAFAIRNVMPRLARLDAPGILDHVISLPQTELAGNWK